MFLTIVALGAAGLVVDGGRALAARRHAAGTAEAAARFAITRQSLTTSFDSDAAVEIRNRADGRPEIVVTITERPTAIVLGLAGVESLTVHATGSAIAVYAP
jgi:Flp pilus assembly protein TadG